MRNIKDYPGEVAHIKRIAQNRARRVGRPEDAGFIARQVEAKRFNEVTGHEAFGEPFEIILTDPVAVRVDGLVDSALQAEQKARRKGVKVKFHSESLGDLGRPYPKHPNQPLNSLFPGDGEQ